MLPYSSFQVGFNGKLFVLSLPVRPASIRDSMCRAEDFVEQMLACPSFPRPEKVLVVGLGPTGMSIALAFLEAGIEVASCSLPEKTRKEIVNECLSACDSRTVCPTTYDFPASHWSSGQFPIQGESIRLPWKANRAGLVIGNIESDFTDLATPYGSLYDRLLAGKVHGIRAAAKGIDAWVSYKPLSALSRRKREWKNYDVILWCTGPGKHRLRLPSSNGRYQGFGFFSDKEPLFTTGLNSSGGSRVLVVGGGDGGLADFVRLLSFNSGDHSVSLKSFGLNNAQIATIWSINDQMWKEFQLPHPVDHSNYLAVFEKMLDLVDLWWTQSTILKDTCTAMLRDSSLRPHVQVAFPCFHFGQAYMGNQIAALLLAKAIMEKGGNGGLVPLLLGTGSGIARMKPSATRPLHRCTADPAACASHPHDARFKRLLCPGIDIPVPGFIAKRLWSSTNPTGYMAVTPKRTVVQFDRVLPRFGATYMSVPLPRSLRAVLRARSAAAAFRDVLPFYQMP